MNYDVLIIGGGINGLSTAYHLSQQKKLKVCLLEQFSVGNPFGGSHGSARITRSVYINPGYSKLVRRAHANEWPALEKELGTQLIYPNQACYYGNGKIFDKYVEGSLATDADIQVIDTPTARTLFPQFTFSQAKKVLLDNTGGVIAAQATLEGLKKIILHNGVALHEETKVLSLDLTQHPIQVSTNKGMFLTERLVVTVGGWLQQLLPQIERVPLPIKQTVAYFTLQGPRESYQIGKFPNWAFIGEGDNPVFYGLPEYKSEGIKISHHVTVGEEDTPLQTAIFEAFIREHFVSPIEKLCHVESCLYAASPNEDFIIDLLPTDKRVAIGSACSGHGFKFAPLTGKILAELVLYGDSSIAEFKPLKLLFSLRFPNESVPSTF